MNWKEWFARREQTSFHTCKKVETRAIIIGYIAALTDGLTHLDGMQYDTEGSDQEYSHGYHSAVDSIRAEMEYQLSTAVEAHASLVPGTKSRPRMTAEEIVARMREQE